MNEQIVYIYFTLQYLYIIIIIILLYWDYQIKGVSRVICDENLIISCATDICVFILNWCSLYYFRKISDKKSEIYHFNCQGFCYKNIRFNFDITHIFSEADFVCDFI